MIGLLDLAVTQVRLRGLELQAPDVHDLLRGMVRTDVDSIELEPLGGIADPPWLVYLNPSGEVFLLEPVEELAGRRRRFFVQGAHARLSKHPRYRRLRDELAADGQLRGRLLARGLREEGGKILPRVVLAGQSGTGAAADPEDDG